MRTEDIALGFTFDDVLLQPGSSEVEPAEVELETRLTRGIRLNLPLLSAAMDTVTESETAISMAQQGGMGVIHRNMSVEEQVKQVDLVKRSESGMISHPITIGPEAQIGEALALMRRFRISGVPVTQAGELVGILTNRDLRFEEDSQRRVSELMTAGRERLVTVRPGITLEACKVLLHEHRIEKLLVVDENYQLVGLITVKDIEKARKYPQASKDDQGRLRVGAAVGVDEDSLGRVEALLGVKCDAIVLDTAHGHSGRVVAMARQIKQRFPRCELIGGNVATGEGALALIEAGVDALKVGVGPGSICTTRVVSGVGVPQLWAIGRVREVAAGYDIPLISDGGIKYSGDMVKALCAGAESVMLGNLLAGTEESPGDMVLYQGRRYKTYRGMGSLGAMRRFEHGAADRYAQGHVSEVGKLVPEGVEGRVPYRGSVAENLYQYGGGIRAGMGYVGARNLAELRQRGRFIRITPASLRESHVHDLLITEEAPNYPLSGG